MRRTESKRGIGFFYRTEVDDYGKWRGEKPPRQLTHAHTHKTYSMYSSYKSIYTLLASSRSPRGIPPLLPLFDVASQSMLALSFFSCGAQIRMPQQLRLVAFRILASISLCLSLHLPLNGKTAMKVPHKCFLFSAPIRFTLALPLQWHIGAVDRGETSTSNSLWSIFVLMLSRPMCHNWYLLFSGGCSTELKSFSCWSKNEERKRTVLSSIKMGAPLV